MSSSVPSARTAPFRAGADASAPVDPLTHLSPREMVGVLGALLCLVVVMAESTVDILPETTILRVLTPLRLVIGLGLVFLLVGGVSPRRLLTVLDLPAVLLLACAGLACVRMGSGWPLWRGLLTSIAFYYLVVGVRRALPKSWSSISLVALTCVMATSFVALSQAANQTKTGFCRVGIDGGNNSCADPDASIRAIGTFPNPNLLAAFLILMTPIAAGFVASQPDRTRRVVGWALIGAAGLALLTTISRGGIGAVVVALIALLLLRRPSDTRIFRIGSIVAILGLAGVAVLSFTGGSSGIRSEVWAAALRISANHPLGVGLGRGGYVLQQAIGGTKEFTHAHNLWLNWLLEAGVVAFVVVIAITVILALQVVRGARTRTPGAIAAGVALAGFAMTSIADHPANASRIALALAFVMALAATSVPERKAHLGQRARRPSRPTPAPARAKRAA